MEKFQKGLATTKHTPRHLNHKGFDEGLIFAQRNIVFQSKNNAGNHSIKNESTLSPKSNDQKMKIIQDSLKFHEIPVKLELGLSVRPTTD